METSETLKEKLAAAGEVVLDIRVVPKSAKSEIVGGMIDGSLKVKVAATPERGRANAELCAVLAAYFGVPKSNVTIEIGETSKRKRVRVKSA